MDELKLVIKEIRARKISYQEFYSWFGLINKCVVENFLKSEEKLYLLQEFLNANVELKTAEEEQNFKSMIDYLEHHFVQPIARRVLTDEYGNIQSWLSNMKMDLNPEMSIELFVEYVRFLKMIFFAAREDINYLEYAQALLAVYVDFDCRDQAVVMKYIEELKRDIEKSKKRINSSKQYNINING